MSLASSILNEAKKVTWCGLWTMTLTSVAVAAGGAACMFMWRDAAQTWEARYYQAAGQLEALKAQLEQMQDSTPVVRQELVISVKDSEFAPKTLALKNRNYLNLKTPSNGDRWKGQIGEDPFGHAIFESPAWSIRAGAITLRTYERKHGIKTVTDLVHRFAEGNREPYIKHLCKALGVKPDQKISLTKRLPELLKAMVYFETGQKLGREHLELVAALR